MGDRSPRDDDEDEAGEGREAEIGEVSTKGELAPAGTLQKR